MAGLARGGAVAFTDDGDEVADSRVMRACMREAARLALPVLCHAEDPSLVRGGAMNEGALATELGLAGRPALAEELAVARNLAIARETGCRVHLQHVSTAGALELVTATRMGGDGAGKSEPASPAGPPGFAATCEATPHHLLLTEEACRGYDPDVKVNPPLRAEADRAALASGLAGGAVDALATDHAPHTPEEKGLEFDLAAPGMVGLETALGLVMTEFVARDVIPPSRMVELMSAAPARILGLGGQGGEGGLGSLKPGARACLTLIDPAAEWEVDPSRFRSRGRNTPFAGRVLKGRAVATMVDGRVVFKA
jgi:dihydroorotase